MSASFSFSRLREKVGMREPPVLANVGAALRRPHPNPLPEEEEEA